MTDMPVLTPPAVMGLYDMPMWESIRGHAMKLQCCRECGTMMYPPAPVCTRCLSDELEWTPISGRATILSWVIFHRTYLPAYPAPYNAIAVTLEEGPIMISNLDSPVPGNNWIGCTVEMVYVAMPDGVVLPRFHLA